MPTQQKDPFNHLNLPTVIHNTNQLGQEYFPWLKEPIPPELFINDQAEDRES